MDLLNHLLCVRRKEYRANVERAIKDSEDIEADDSEKSDYGVYKAREQQYLSLLIKGSGSLFSAFSGSPFKRACKTFVSYACKTYIYSEGDLVKIIHPWVLEKGMQFDKRIAFQ